MENIKSTYIINNIFNYINNDNFKYKLFFYSKKYQKIFNIELFDYIRIFFDKIKMNSIDKYDKYLCFNPDNIKNKTQLLKEYLLNYNVSIDYLINNINKYFEKNKEKFLKEMYINNEFLIEEKDIRFDNSSYTYYKYPYNGFKEVNEGIKLVIDINSPFFEKFYTSKIFEELFIIPIYSESIDKFNLKNDYFNTFKKLNDINSNYSSINFSFKDNKDISYLKDFNIKFEQIKNLIIDMPFDTDYLPDSCKIDYNIFFKDLFSLNNIANSLIYLNIEIKKSFEEEYLIDENILENLNKFKVLENLKLKGLKSKNIFELKINTLKILSIECTNIYINKVIESNLKKLIISSKISKSLLQLSQLEYLQHTNFNDSDIDFESLKNLKVINYFAFDIYNIPYNKNPSVEKLIFKSISDDFDINFNSSELQKLPNLIDLTLYISVSFYRRHKWGYPKGEVNLEIKENPNCKIKKIDLLLYDGNIKLFCQSFEKLEILKINIISDFFEKDSIFYAKCEILNISDALPMFSDKKKIIYKSLNELELGLNQTIDLEKFKNLSNSIDNMPNLKKFSFSCTTNIDKDFYEEFIRKILSLKLNIINININIPIDYTFNKEYYDSCLYSFEELKKINKNVESHNFENIKIINIEKIEKCQ